MKKFILFLSLFLLAHNVQAARVVQGVTVYDSVSEMTPSYDPNIFPCSTISLPISGMTYCVFKDSCSASNCAYCYYQNRSLCQSCMPGYSLSGTSCVENKKLYTLYYKNGDGSIYQTYTVDESSSQIISGNYISKSVDETNAQITLKCSSTNRFWTFDECTKKFPAGNSSKSNDYFCIYGSNICETQIKACADNVSNCAKCWLAPIVGAVCTSCQAGYSLVSDPSGAPPSCVKNNTVSYCPTGLAKSTDGCCCLK